MLFRNLSIYRFPARLRGAFDDVDAALAAHALKPVGPLELESTGFISPFGPSNEVFAHRVGNALLIVVGREQRLLPAAVVNRELDLKIAAAKARGEREPGPRARRQMREEMVHELLPRAFAKPSRTHALIDLERNLLVIDVASRKTADAVSQALRAALGAFPALPIDSTKSLRGLFSGWLAGGRLPDGMELGEGCDLRDPADTRVLVRCRGQDLLALEVGEHLKAGKQAARIELVDSERLSFELGDDLVIRRLRFLEAATAEIESDEAVDARAELDAQLALLAGEVGRLYDRLEPHLALPPAAQ